MIAGQSKEKRQVGQAIIVFFSLTHRNSSLPQPFSTKSKNEKKTWSCICLVLRTSTIGFFSSFSFCFDGCGPYFIIITSHEGPTVKRRRKERLLGPIKHHTMKDRPDGRLVCDVNGARALCLLLMRAFIRLWQLLPTHTLTERKTKENEQPIVPCLFLWSAVNIFCLSFQHVCGPELSSNQEKIVSARRSQRRGLLLRREKLRPLLSQGFFLSSDTIPELSTSTFSSSWWWSKKESGQRRAQVSLGVRKNVQSFKPVGHYKKKTMEADWFSGHWRTQTLDPQFSLSLWRRLKRH